MQGSNSSRAYVQQAYAGYPYAQNQGQFFYPQMMPYESPMNYRMVKSEARPEQMGYRIVVNQPQVQMPPPPPPPPVPQQQNVNVDTDWRMRGQQFETQYHSVVAHCRELEQRINIMHTEKEKLKSVLLERNAELDSLKYENANVSISLNEMRVYQSKIIDLEARLSKNLSEIETWQMKFYELQKEYTILESSKANESVDRNYYESEIRRLRELFEQKSLEIEEWKMRANKIREPNPVDTQLRFENERLQSEIYSLKSGSLKIEDLEFENSRLKTQIDEYRMKISSLESEVYEYRSSKTSSFDLESKIALLTQEIERLNSMNNRKQTEIESLRVQSGNSSELMQLRQLIDVKNVEIEELRAKLDNYDMKFALLTQEIERLNAKTGGQSEALRESIRRTSVSAATGGDLRKISSTYNVRRESNTELANQIVRESLNKTSYGNIQSSNNLGVSHKYSIDQDEELRKRGITEVRRGSKYY